MDPFTGPPGELTQYFYHEDQSLIAIGSQARIKPYQHQYLYLLLPGWDVYLSSLIIHICINPDRCAVYLDVSHKTDKFTLILYTYDMFLTNKSCILPQLANIHQVGLLFNSKNTEIRKLV